MSCTPYDVASETPYLKADAKLYGTLYNPDDPSQLINVELIFDTGADISLGPASLATALGLNLTAGDPITLIGVGGSVNAYIHYVRAKIAGKDIELPIAIAEIEDIPILFGMYGPMDQFRSFIMDNLNRQLCFEVVPKPPIWETLFPRIWKLIFG